MKPLGFEQGKGKKIEGENRARGNFAKCWLNKSLRSKAYPLGYKGVR